MGLADLHSKSKYSIYQGEDHAYALLGVLAVQNVENMPSSPLLVAGVLIHLLSLPQPNK